MILVLLPGMIGTDDLFAPLLKVLPASVDRRIITYPADRILSYADHFKIVEAELARETEPLILLGESYSGAIAVMYAAAFPQRVIGVILSAGYVTPPWAPWVRWFIHPFVIRIPIPNFLIRYFAAGAEASDEMVAFVRAALKRPAPKVMAYRARESLIADFTDELARSTAPILYLAPDQDRMVRRSAMEKIFQIRPDVKVAPMKGPHLILQVSPVEGWNFIERFIGECSSVASASRR